MRIKFIRVDEGDRKKLALNLAKLSQKRTEKGSRAGDLLARMGTHKFNPEGASTGPLKAPIHGGDEDKAKRLTKRASFFREKGLSTPGQADPGTAKERAAALRAGRASGDARRFWRQNASTELFGNKIVEGFNRLIEEYTGKDDPKKAQDYASPEAQAARKARDERRLAALKTKEGEKKSTEKVGKFVKKVRSVKGQGNPGESGFISGQGRRSAIQRSIAAENKRRAEAGHEPAKTPPRNKG